jgi:hypothetical protein
VDHERRRREQHQRQHVEPALVGQLDRARQLGPPVGLRDQPLEVRRVQDVGLHRHGERQRRDRQQLAGHPQRRQAEQQGDDAAGHRADDERDEHVDAPPGQRVCHDHAAHADEADLAEADHATPAGEHDEGQGREAERDAERGGVDLRRRAGQRDGGEHHRDHRRDQQLRAPDLGQPGELPRQLAHPADHRPRALAGVAGPALGPALQQQADHDHEQHDQLGRVAPLDVPVDELLDHADAHAGGERSRQRAHAAQHRGGQAGQQDRGADRGVEREALVGRPQHDGQRRETAHDRPQQQRQLVDRDADEPGPVHVLGHAPHRGAGVGPLQEPQQRDQHGGHDGHEQQVVAVERRGLEPELGGRERRVEAGDDRVDAQPARHEQGDAAEDLSQADRGDGQHQAGRALEPADDEPLARRPQQHADHHTGGRGEGPRPVLAERQAGGEPAAHAAHGAVGEVDDAGRPVGEDEPDRQQPVPRAEDGAPQHDVDRRPRLVGERLGGGQQRDGEAAGDDPTPTHRTPPARPRATHPAGSAARSPRSCRARR